MFIKVAHFVFFVIWENKLFLIFFALINLFFPSLGIGENKLSSVHKIIIPRFDSQGYVSSELHAFKLTQKKENIFLAVDPVLYLFAGQTLETTAKSNSGEFLLDKGMAKGHEMFEVLGKGFNARGRNWSWQDLTKAGENQIIFKENAKVFFQRGLGGFFASKRKITESNCSPEDIVENYTIKNDDLVPTIANANYLEFVTVEENTHRFLLEGNVSIEGNNLFLTCEKIEVLFTKETNSTTTPIGEVSMMYALGNVILRQGGRKSYCDRMTLDVKAGNALLLGSARVIDDEWGVASGEKIILEKGKRLAKVIGEKTNRPKLELPPLPNLGFSKKSKKPKLK